MRISDWSSDVCSSYLINLLLIVDEHDFGRTVREFRFIFSEQVKVLGLEEHPSRGFFRLEPEFGGASEIVFGLFGVEVGKRVVLNIARRIRRRTVARCAATNMFLRPIVVTRLTGRRRGRKKQSDHLQIRRGSGRERG